VPLRWTMWRDRALVRWVRDRSFEFGNQVLISNHRKVSAFAAHPNHLLLARVCFHTHRATIIFNG
jgi:hypothetical protein